MQLHSILEKYLPLISGMMIPALFFAVCLFNFLSNDGLSAANGEFFHWSIYVLGVSTILLQLYFNRGKGVFFVASLLVFYTLINHLRNINTETYSEDLIFQTIISFLPYNLLFFYICYPRRMISKHSLFAIIVILFEYGVLETLLRNNISPVFYFYNINVLSVVGFCGLVIYSLINSVRNGELWDYTILYSAISVGVACFYTKFSGQEMFVFLSLLFIFICILYNLIYGHFFDKQTGLRNRNSFRYYSAKLPLKYSVAIVRIDSFDNVLKKIGPRNVKTILTLINDVFQEYIGDDMIFRSDYDKFIFVYKKFDIKEAYAHIEEIRRAIAGLSFAYSERLPLLKMTISCGVSEKKRSDRDVFEVIARAEKAMNETAKFSHNVTTKG